MLLVFRAPVRLVRISLGVTSTVPSSAVRNLFFFGHFFSVTDKPSVTSVVSRPTRPTEGFESVGLRSIGFQSVGLLDWTRSSRLSRPSVRNSSKKEFEERIRLI